MKFGENLQAHLTPEWRSQYIDYELIKSMLYECREEAPDSDISDQSVVQRYYARFEEKFFAVCDKELTKVNTFFAEKLAESTRKFTMLQNEIQAQKDSVKMSETKLRNRRKSVIFLRAQEKREIKTVKDLKLAFSEFYLSLILLQNYQELNFTGFRKILKKHDKMLETDKGFKWRQRYVETAPFYTDSHISQLILKIETLYINDLENGNRAQAMKRLRVPPLNEVESYPRWTVFRFGLFLGMFSVLVAVTVISAIALDIDVDPWLLLNLYQPGLVIFLFLFFIGINIWGWRSAGVNHVLIFGIDPRNHLSHHHMFEMSAFMAIMWGLSGIFLLFSNYLEVIPFPSYLNPILLYGVYFLFLFNPFPVLYRKARFWLLKRLWRLFACGFYPVEFADFWLADQLNSMVSLFLDFEFVICFYGFDGDVWSGWKREPEQRICGSYAYGIRAILACYPAFIRFVQCLRRFYDSRKWFPHFVNAGKYSTTFFRVTFQALYVLHYEQTNELRSVYFYLWLACLFISSCYTFAWDIKMDWGFLDKNAGENKWLREEIVYPHKTYYYLAAILDLLLRFSWIIQVSIRQSFAGIIAIERSLASTFVVLEVFRRFVWNFFRLENEHLNNCGEFRAVRDISVAPLREDDLSTLVKMMDEENGVEEYRRRIREESGGSKSLGSTIARKLSTLRRNNSSGVMLYVGSGGSDEEGTSTSVI